MQLWYEESENAPAYSSLENSYPFFFFIASNLQMKIHMTIYKVHYLDPFFFFLINKGL